MPPAIRRIALAALTAAVTACASMGNRPPADATLYRRLGGYDGIAAFTDDFLSRALPDPVVAPFFRGMEPEDLHRARQRIVELLCAKSGGPCFYTGRDMKTAHAQLEITNQVWNAFTGHLNETAAHFQLAERERNDLVQLFGGMRADIVNH